MNEFREYATVMALAHDAEIGRQQERHADIPKLTRLSVLEAVRRVESDYEEQMQRLAMRLNAARCIAYHLDGMTPADAFELLDSLSESIAQRSMSDEEFAALSLER